MNQVPPQPHRPDTDPSAPDALDRYLDDAMTPPQREAFERRLDDDATLRAELERQRRIDGALRRGHAWVEQDAARPLPADDRPAPAARGGAWWQIGRSRHRFAAASLLLALGGLLAAIGFGVSPFGSEAEPLAAVYQREIDAGFVPGWVCETEAEFVETYAKRFQTPLRLADAAGVEAVGLTYNYSLGPGTVMLLARVDGRPVIVFAASTRLLDRPPGVGDRGLQLFERRMGTVRLFELTPHDEAKVLELFEPPPQAAD
ncbi:MAG: hypothetical protein AAF800_10860 [Planctomycetota bacterium]